MKPNGLFSSMKGKRAVGLKPNGLFSLTKKNVMPDEDVFSTALTNILYGPPSYHNPVHWGIPRLFGAYKRSIKPNGLFNLNKRALKPNGLFSVGKKDVSNGEVDLKKNMYDYSYDMDEDDVYIDETEDIDDDIAVEEPEKKRWWKLLGHKGEKGWQLGGRIHGTYWM